MLLALFLPCSQTAAAGEPTTGRIATPRAGYEASVEDEEEDENDRIQLYEPLLPCLAEDPQLEARCTEALGARPLVPTEVSKLLKELATTRRLWGRNSSRYVGPWVWARDQLRKLPPTELAPLRGASPSLRKHDRSSSPAAALAGFRAAPWSDEAHRRLLATADGSLRSGQWGLAVRSYRDVLDHSVEPELLTAARAGYWLALAQSPETTVEVIERAFARVDRAREWPWLGGRATTDAIGAALLESARASATERSRDPELPREATTVELPTTAAWTLPVWAPDGDERWPSPFGNLSSVSTTDGQRFLVSGPRLLACFRTDGELLWSKSRATWDDVVHDRSDNNRILRIPGAFHPAASADRIWTRWSSPTAFGLSGLAAFDVRTGMTAWSSSLEPEWERLTPVSDPVLAEGRVWVLAADKVHLQLSPLVTLYLVSLETTDGSFLWARPLVTGTRTLELQKHGPVSTVDIVHFGQAVAVHEGAVYCATSMGVIARCDARDGLIEWTRTYPRVTRPHTFADAMARSDVGPLVHGDRVIFAPRDHEGVFAVDSASGRRRWAEPIHKAQHLVGMAGDTLLVRDGKTLEGRRVRDGKRVWRRTVEFSSASEGLEIHDGEVFVLERGNQVIVLDSTSGKIARKIAPPESMATRMAAELAIDDKRIAWLDAGASWELGREAAPAGTKLAPPLTRILHLSRVGPRLFAAPREGVWNGRVIVASAGTLECTDSGGPLWQRVAPFPVETVAWCEADELLLVAKRRLHSLAVTSGVSRWDLELSFDARPVALSEDRCCLVGPRENELALVDTSAGEVIWQRKLERGARAFGCFIDQQEVVLGVWQRSRGESVHIAALDPTGGEELRNYRLGNGRHIGWFGVETNPPTCFFGARKHELSELDLRSGKTIEYPLADMKRDQRTLERMQVAGRWRLLQESVNRKGKMTHLVVHDRQGAKSPWERLVPDDSRAIDLTNGHLIERGTRKLWLTDLETRETRTIALPARPQWGDIKETFDARVHDGKLWVFSKHASSPQRDDTDRLRLDLFRLDTAERLVSQLIPSVCPTRRHGDEKERPWKRLVFGGTKVAFAGESLFVTDAHGVHVFRTDSEAPLAPHRVFVHHASSPIRVDGALDDWATGTTLLEPTLGPRGDQLGITHDDERLYVMARVRDGQPVHPVGAEPALGGDRLELAMTLGRRSLRWSVLPEPLGARVATTGTIYNGRDSESEKDVSLVILEVPKNLDVAFSYDVERREYAYEIALPLSVLGSPAEVRDLRLSAAAWDDRPGGTGAVRRTTWGGALGGEFLHPGAHVELLLHPLTATAHDEAMARLREADNLSETFDAFDEDCVLRATTARHFVELHAELIREHPDRVTAAWLARIDREARVRFGEVLTEEIVDIAAAAGVKAAVRQLYAQYSTTYIRQEINVPGGTKRFPRCLAIVLVDADGAEHVGYWGKKVDGSRPPPVQIGPAFEMNAWLEIRLPLLLVDMQDRPITAMGFLQQGETPVLFGRSVLVVGDKEQDMIVERMPKESLDGQWQWTRGPSKDQNAHRSRRPSGRYAVVRHGVRFEEPIVIHTSSHDH